MRRSSYILGIVSFLGVTGYSSSALGVTLTLTPSETLVIDFTVQTSPLINTADTLYLGLGNVEVIQPFTTRTSQLFNGNSLLGNYSSSSFGNFTGNLALFASERWKSATSLFTLDNPTVIDFSSINNSSIDGRINFTIQTGQMNIDSTQIYISLLKANKTSGGTPIPGAEVTAVNLQSQSVPEPITVLGLLTGVGFGVRMMRRFSSLRKFRTIP